ncbi:hypothetical protein AOB46_18035 [Chryseobacterium indologenes]|uniref:Uncharacterized protein n=2 Tax=Chryseobacterium indologenes TaxID=253 RepID=A0A0N0IUQ8_CHRID|nr:hypothetical protein AOB46_18035 [Chryseobacterium indologenes]
MCRYAGKGYKIHYACFKCRKSFKQQDSYDIFLRIKKENVYHAPDGSVRKIGHLFMKANKEELDLLIKEIESRSVKCPECGNIMTDLGREFKAPKKTAVKEWEIIEGLFRTGKIFYTCGCYGIGYIPKNPKDYEQYLKNILSEYQQQMITCQDKTIEECPDKLDAVKYWSKKISEVKAEMNLQRFEIF